MPDYVLSSQKQLRLVGYLQIAYTTVKSRNGFNTQLQSQKNVKITKREITMSYNF